MSHGGMGGGGGHGGGYGGHGHGGHGHHGAMAGHHADQSPAWNMAMQAEKDMGKRLRITDPRFLVGLTLFVFVGLITLPYTMDYLQNQHIAGQGGVVEGPTAEDSSSGPSAAALGMVGATLFGHGVRLPEGGMGGGMAESAPQSQSQSQSQSFDTRGSEQQHQQQQLSDSGHDSASTAPDDRDGNLSDTTNGADPHSEASATAGSEEYGGPETASQSAQLTIKDMVAASGLSPGPNANAASHPNPSFGMAAAQGTLQARSAAPVAVPSYGTSAALPYGGAIRTNQQYYVYVPNQQFGQPNAGYGQAAMQPQMTQRTMQPQMAPPASSLQVAALPQSASGQIPRQSMDQRSPFNPQTSAIVCPMGMRQRAPQPTVPMVPTGSGDDGGQRMRVWVPR